MKLVALVLLQFSFLAGVRSQEAGATCSNNACTSPVVCDSDNMCKKAIGADCTDGATAYCPVNAVCQGTAGTSSSAQCLCTGHFQADGVYCKASAGRACNAGGTPAVTCSTGSTCSSPTAAGTCLADVGRACNAGGTPAVTCFTGSTCSSPTAAGTCLVSTGADCSSTKSTLCKSTDLCENNFCRIKHAGSCVNNTLNCVAGATCVTSGSASTCTCKTDLSTPNTATGKCDPKANKIGGTCTGTSCEDTNAECPSGTCTCQTIYVTSPANLTCGLNVGVDCSSNTNLCITGSFCQSGKCKRAAGQYCTGTGDAANCVSQSDCTNAKCTCQTGYTARDGLCSAAAGLFMSSLLTLLVVMTWHLL